MVSPSSQEFLVDSSSGDINILDILDILGGYRTWLLLVPVCAVTITLVFTTFFVRPSFTAATQLLVPQQGQNSAAALLSSSVGGLAAVAGGGGLAAALKNPADQWVGLLRSQTVADALIQQFHLRDIYKTQYQFEAREQLARNTKVVAGKDGFIRVEVEDHVPERAAEIANAYVAQLQSLTKNLAFTEAAQRRIYFEKLMKESSGNLTKAEIALRGVGVGESLLKTKPEAVAGLMAQTRAQISALEIRIASLKTYATDKSPDMIHAYAELAALRRQLTDAGKSTPLGNEVEGNSYISLYRDFKYHEKLFELMASQYEMARADEARQGALIQVVDFALVPEYKSKPQRAFAAVIAASASLLLAMTVILIRRALQRAQAEKKSRAA